MVEEYDEPQGKSAMGMMLANSLKGLSLD